MSVGANTVAAAYTADLESMVTSVPDGWFRRVKGIVAGITGVPISTLNGVWTEEVELDPAVVSELLDQVANFGFPYCLQLRPGASEELSALADDRGMIKQDQTPLMVLEDTGRIKAAQKVAGLVIRQLSAEEAELHATVAARGFEVPVEPFIQLMTPSALRRAGVRCYVGELDGEVVTTGLGSTLVPSVGIFNIATPPEHRGKGFGAAITARAVSDGFEGGAIWSYLQSSPAGYNVYERLGFATVERWDYWVTAS
jgi:GNAT superfamily N-acetyltransferase